MPFIVVPLDFHQSFPKVGLGDIAAVSYQGKTTYAIVGDKGPAGAVGEGSIALAASFGFSTDPQKGGVDGGVQYLIFPGSRDPTPPREAGPVQLKGRRLLEESGLLLR